MIYPAYQNTIIGEVIGYLDYYMKCYLNGGTHSKDFLERWHHNPNNDREYLLNYSIDLKKLVKANGIEYIPYVR